VAPRAVDADAWATALMVLGPHDGVAVARREGVAALLLSWRGDRLIATETPAFADLAAARAAPTAPADHGGWLLPIATFLIMAFTAAALGVRRVAGCGRDCTACATVHQAVAARAAEGGGGAHGTGSHRS
jgi:hypothetical protein